MLPLLISLAPLVTGEIFGDIRSGDDYLAEVPVQLVCGADTVEATTDKAGSFRLKTKGSGKCKLTVTWKEQSPTIDVVVFARPTRYRFIIEEREAKLVLKRV
jgi:hypothetical protein